MNKDSLKSRIQFEIVLRIISKPYKRTLITENTDIILREKKIFFRIDTTWKRNAINQRFGTCETELAEASG